MHRDVSPQNVLVDTSGLVKLIDFGVAKAATNVNKTGAGLINGKIGYMSPEQACGLSIDRRSDIYAVGIVLYEALTLQRIFAGDDPLRILARVQASDTPPTDTILEGQAPEALRAALKRSLAAKPEDRYATAGEMERDLSRAQSEIDPAYTAHDLAKLVREIDTDHEARVERFRTYSKINPAAILAGEQVLSADVMPTVPKVPGDPGATTDGLDVAIDVKPVKKLNKLIPIVITMALAITGGSSAAFWYISRPPPVAHVQMRTLLLDSEPISAKVFIDGELKGLTPATLSGIAAGAKHTVRVEKQGYEPNEQTLDATGPATVSLRVELKALPGQGGPTPGAADGDKPTPDKAGTKAATKATPEAGKRF